ncbi:complement factor H-like [Prinia subflava]|uniref:complement factor H-like n=1 Tax=Prinia subflava TaxID=208062 RepID=UPI002FDFC0A7
MAGASTVVCQNGTWTELPTCKGQAGTCGRPSAIQSGELLVFPLQEYQHGDSVEYKCPDFYTLKGSPTITCLNGQWTDPPVCLAGCTVSEEDMDRNNIELKWFVETKLYSTSGDYIEFRCKAGYLEDPNTSSFRVQCVEGTLEYPRCTPGRKPCDYPAIENGQLSISQERYRSYYFPKRFGQTIDYRCLDGYSTPTGHYWVRSTCTERGWSPEPKCLKIICSPPVISSGNFSPQKDKYTLGNTITVDCDAGYHFKVVTGRNTAECTKNGWVPDPACVRKPCDYPAIENGQLSISQERYRSYYFPKRFGQTIDYRCLDGYSTPTGHYWVRSTCTERGWSPEPKCLKKCPSSELENGYFPRHGRDVFYKEGETVRYGCYSNYQAQHEAVTCTRNGWAPPPRCTPKKQCQTIVFENGFLRSAKQIFDLKETIAYECLTGFVTPEGQETGHTQCQESGWTPPPKCIKSCQAPGDILIHHTNKTVFLPEDTIEYSCLEGYKTTNNMPTDTAVCGKNGEWSPATQCREIECALPPMSNGDFSPKKGKYRSGAVVKFTCAKNYIRVGPASSQCYHFGWFPSPPVCQVSVTGCGPPPEITNGSVVGGSVEQYQHGDTKQYECNSELKLVGSKEIECIDGQWSSLPSCIEDKTPCESPSSIPNVVLHQAEQTQYSHGDEVTCGCKPGSGNTEEMKIKCLHGEWKPLPVCADASPQCVVPEDVELVRSVQYPMSRRNSGFHKVIHYRCTSADESVKQATCVSGRWTPEIACTAEESVCPPPPQVSGAQQTTVGRSSRSGSKAAFSCPDGFLLVGRKEITCTEGKWQSPPHCVEKPCLPPQSVECADAPRLENPKFRIEREGKATYLAGARFQYVSRPGYMLDGPTETICSMGKWSAPPSCLEMPCGRAPKVANSRFEGRKKKSYEPGETIRYHCDSGFLIAGSPEIICRKGNWTAPPFCEDVSCGAAPEIPNARIASAPQERYLPGAKVYYQCESNFQMAGGDYVLCSNGQWSQAPVCRDVNCDPPPEIAGGRIDGIRKSRYVPGESAKYQCWKNFNMAGASTVVCQNGTWTELPTCKGQAGTCGTPPAIQSGELLVFPLQEYQHGDSVEYKCPDFYTLKGSPTITCLNGQWTDPPVCLVTCTVSEEDMDRNNIELKWRAKTKLYSTSGDYIEFRCKAGYLEDTSISSFRVQCVEGTLEYPRCTPGRSCVLDRNTMERNHIQLQSPHQPSPHYGSGHPVFFECKPGYQHVSHREQFRAQCLDGRIAYPECESSSWFG